MSDWERLATTHGGVVGYPDPTAAVEPLRFYRVWTMRLSAEDDWKNQIHVPADAFLSFPTSFQGDEILWVKFGIVSAEPERVIFQDSRRHLFHYDFATQRLAPFEGMTPAEFDQVSLYMDGRQILLGAILIPPVPNESEYGIQFVGLDPYPREAIREAFDRVRSVVAAPGGVKAIYLPTYEQAAVAAENEAYFAEHGIEIGSITRWIQEAMTYAPGWAVGRLKYIPAAEIEAAFADGRLRPDDILVTDAVPAEIPILAGVLCLSPATPNSHVAILARSFGIPFGYLADPAVQAEVLSWDGRRVAVRATEGFVGDEVKVIDVEDELTPELEAELLDLKAPPELSFPPRAVYGSLSVATESLTPADVQFVGGKAANFGFLRREIPDHSPPALAFTFDLWESFLNQTLPGGLTLRATIDARLGGYTYPPDMSELQADLNAIRDLIRNGTDFDAAQHNGILSALSIFDADRKIRFRSSTNLEDTEHFTGAGLYDSYSGCLLDDLDGDGVGPSHCDPEEPNERGVLRALKRVYASFYNLNAFLERLRHGIAEDDVGMAVLVHHSFPDEIELANGVARLDVTASGTPFGMHGEMVTQLGAVSVTNPEGNALPEVVQASRYSFGTYFFPVQTSSLVPLGGHVLAWEDEYQEFIGLFADVADGYAAYFPEKARFMLDFEYKKSALDGLVVKQVREIPLPDTSGSLTPFLLNEPACFHVFQGERGDVFGNHRLKSRWNMETRSMRLSESNLAATLYRSATHEFVLAGQRDTLTGSPADWPDAEYELLPEGTLDSWTVGEGDSRRDLRLRTNLPREVPASSSPLVTISDREIELWAHYASPQPALDYEGNPITVNQEVAILFPCATPAPTDLKQDRRLEFDKGAVIVDIGFYWPKYPGGILAGYTAPLVRWDRTTIIGLTSEPIELQGWFSQTYRPGHHNFTEEFIFEPRLEPDLPATTLQELESADIVLLHVTTGLLDAPLRILGADGRFRNVP